MFNTPIAVLFVTLIVTVSAEVRPMKHLFCARIPVFRQGYVWRKSAKGRELTLTHNLLSDPGPVTEWPKREFFFSDQAGSQYLVDYKHVPMYLLPGGDGFFPHRSDFFRYYNPFDEPALFQVLADVVVEEGDLSQYPASVTDRELESMLAFCNTYGAYEPLGDSGYDARSMKTAVMHMRHAVELWEATRRGDRSAVDKLDVIINRTGYTTLTMTSARGPTGQMELGFHIGGDLLTALWCQFVLAVAENKQFRRCATCNRPFEVSPEVNRKDRTICSDACRAKAYRRRKASALKLREAGKNLREIAKEIGSDPQTIKGWLQEKK
ncbi:MAG: helix-turn-helix domain-containing protein [Planctomycetota bacterium]